MSLSNHAPFRSLDLLRRVRVAGALLAWCVLGSACSHSEPSPPAGPPEKVTIAYATLSESALAQVAYAQGYFRDAGLEVTAHLHPYGKLALQELLAGQADFATVAETPVMLAILNGAEISVIASIQSSQKNHAIVARKDKGILAPQDLKGKTLATTLGVTADYFMDGFLAVRGISRQELTVVNRKQQDLQQAIASGEVAAVATFQPFLYQIEQALGTNGVTFYDPDIYTATFNLVATRDFIHRHPETVRKVLRALAKAEQYVRTQPAQAQEIVAKFTGIEPGIVRGAWANSTYELTLHQALLLGLEDEARWAIKGGMTSAGEVPNYLDYIYFPGLSSVKPEAITILR